MDNCNVRAEVSINGKRTRICMGLKVDCSLTEESPQLGEREISEIGSAFQEWLRSEFLRGYKQEGVVNG